MKQAWQSCGFHPISVCVCCCCFPKGEASTWTPSRATNPEEEGQGRGAGQRKVSFSFSQGRSIPERPAPSAPCPPGPEPLGQGSHPHSQWQAPPTAATGGCPPLSMVCRWLSMTRLPTASSAAVRWDTRCTPLASLQCTSWGLGGAAGVSVCSARPSSPPLRRVCLRVSVCVCLCAAWEVSLRVRFTEFAEPFPCSCTCPCGPLRYRPPNQPAMFLNVCAWSRGGVHMDVGSDMRVSMSPCVCACASVRVRVREGERDPWRVHPTVPPMKAQQGTAGSAPPGSIAPLPSFQRPADFSAVAGCTASTADGLPLAARRTAPVRVQGRPQCPHMIGFPPACGLPSASGPPHRSSNPRPCRCTTHGCPDVMQPHTPKRTPTQHMPHQTCGYSRACTVAHG